MGWEEYGKNFGIQAYIIWYGGQREPLSWVWEKGKEGPPTLLQLFLNMGKGIRGFQRGGLRMCVQTWVKE